jgi:Fur family ferric uptake transcriptional regulator
VDYIKAHEILTGYLKKENNRITPERFQVLDAALDYDGHFGADDLYIKMKNGNYRISRATVYNTLELLENCELLVKRNFGENITRYESKFGRKNHDHLICIKCGKIREFSNPKIRSLVSEICDDLEYEFSGYSFNIFGKCPDHNDEN